jgi:CMP-N,N'-diacetyllegionaminic acid synthase
MNFPRTIATICARGGSKGLPGKNIRPSRAGRSSSTPSPTRCAAPASRRVRVDRRRAHRRGRARGAGAHGAVPAAGGTGDRPGRQAAGHRAPGAHLEAEGESIARIVDLQPTSPLREPADITARWPSPIAPTTRAGGQRARGGTTTRTSTWWSRAPTALVRLSKGDGSARRQDTPPVFALNGSIYVWQRAALAHAAVHGLWSVRIAAYPMPRWKSVDIDDLEDFEHAEWLHARHGAGGAHDAPVFVIAEAGVNHNGDLALAFRLCEAARDAGADAVKFQTFRAEDLVVPGAPTAGTSSARPASPTSSRCCASSS